MSETNFSAFRAVPRTGVIYVTTEAQKMGFRFGAEGWCNLGQGQPETGPLPGAPPRITHLDIALNDQEYAPVAGLWEVREAIAKIVPGLEQLADIDVAKREFHIANRVMHAPRFGTPDGKAHFVVTSIPPRPGALTLATVRSEGQFNTMIYEETDSYRGHAPRDAIFLNLSLIHI